MSEDILFASARFGLGLGLLLFGVLYMYRKTRLDAFRSDLFAIRDEAFNFAMSHGRAFDNPAYQRLRDAINGTIRFAHQFDLASIVLASLVVRDRSAEPSLLDSLEAEPDPEMRAFLVAAYHRVSRRGMRYVLFEGSQAIAMVPLIALYVLWKRRGRWLAELPPAATDRLMRLGHGNSREARALLRI